jgi:hypothetical protein
LCPLNEANTLQAIKIEGENDSAPPAVNEDTEMGEGSMAASDDEDGEDGDDVDDDEGSVSAQDSPSKPPRTFSPSDLPHMKEIPSIGSKDTDMSGTDDLPGPPLPNLEPVDTKAESPSKDVALTNTSPTHPPEPAEDPLSSAPPPLEVTLEPAADIKETNAAMLQAIAGTAPETIPEPPPNPTITEVISAVEAQREEEEEEEMLLDLVENTNRAPIVAPQETPAPEPLPLGVPEEPHPSKVVEEPQRVDQPTPTPVSATLPEAVVEKVAKEATEQSAEKPVEQSAEKPVEQSAEKPVEQSSEQPKQPVEEDEDYPDLLGQLEQNVQ